MRCYEEAGKKEAFFSSVFIRDLWGGARGLGGSRSGPGSRVSSPKVKTFLHALDTILDDWHEPRPLRLLDCACGDLKWLLPRLLGLVSRAMEACIKRYLCGCFYFRLISDGIYWVRRTARGRRHGKVTGAGAGYGAKGW